MDEMLRNFIRKLLRKFKELFSLSLYHVDLVVQTDYRAFEHTDFSFWRKANRKYTEPYTYMYGYAPWKSSRVVVLSFTEVEDDNDDGNDVDAFYALAKTRPPKTTTTARCDGERRCM